MDDVVFINPETLEPVEPPKEEEKPRRTRHESLRRNEDETPREINVRSAWPCAFNGQVLVYYNDDYRLMPKIDWPRAMKFSMTKAEFDKLPKPKAFSESLEENISRWKKCEVK